MTYPLNRYMLLGLVVLWAAGSPAAAGITDFDDLTLPPESHWDGPDPVGTIETVLDPWSPPSTMTLVHGSFQSGHIAFDNTYNQTYPSWQGFAYSNETDATTPGWANQYSAFAGGGAGPGPDNYGIGFGYSDQPAPGDVPTLRITDPTLHIQSAKFTNMTYPALVMQQGDPNGFSQRFGYRDSNNNGLFTDPGDYNGDYPDWLLLTVHGQDSAGNPIPDTVEFYLADYRFADDTADYIVAEWTEVDLSPLSAATTLYFALSSSDSGFWGMNTPAYFAIDDIVLAPMATPVPEPATWLLALGGAVLAFRRRRRHRK